MRALRIAPIKGLACVDTERVLLEAGGVAEDRRLLLLAPDDSVVTLRRYPGLTRVAPRLDLGAGTLDVTFPDGATVTSALTPTGERLQTTLFGKPRSGRLLPGPVGEALSEYVGEPLRLVLADATGNGWDEGPVSLIGSASAEQVEVPAENGSPASARFRMLIEVDGLAPYEEDSWVGRDVTVGEALLRVTHCLQRCVVINHSAVTGAKNWDGLRRLADLRGRDRLTLGVIADVVRPGEVAVGAPVTL